MRGLDEICAILRSWPRNVLPDYRTLARECAEHARELFDAPKAVLVHSEGDEPWLMISGAERDATTWREVEEPDQPLVDESLAGASFLFTPLDRVESAPGGAPVMVAQAIHPMVLAEFDEAPVLSIPVDSEDSKGRLFIFDPHAERQAMLKVADVVGTVLSIRFEATAHSILAVADAVTEERTRVARDLHDGLLQSFTGVVLQLETIHSTMDAQPEEAKRMITQTQSIMMSDQRELRRFVEQLRPRGARRDAAFDFPERIEDLKIRFESQWGVRILFDVDRIDPSVGAFLGHETFRLIHEAVTNSARHGGASEVRVALRTLNSVMQIEISDNGSGFSFHGRMTLAQMQETGAGPRVLAERVHSLNGNLVVDSTDTGSTVSISVPLGWGGS